MKNIILMGAPAAGKGVYSAKLQEKYGIPKISTGDLLRAEIAMGTEIGRRIQKIMDSGEFVSDEIVIELLTKRIKSDDCKNGFILDGFPRTETQAEVFDEIASQEGFPISSVIVIDVSLELVLERVCGRRICDKCGKIFNVKTLPSANGDFCDAENCNGKLISRPDDTEETMKKRYEKYLEETAPVIDHYKQYDLVSVVTGRNDADGVFNDIVKIIEKQAIS